MLGEPDSFDVRATAFSSGMINQIFTTYEFGKVFAVTEGIWDISSALPFEASFHACFEDASIVFEDAMRNLWQFIKMTARWSIPSLSGNTM